MSLYWDDFEKRAKETVNAIKNDSVPKVRRVAIFITNKCNFRCKYCNHKKTSLMLSQRKFEKIIEQYGKDAILHITGGEPSVVPWLYHFLKEHGNTYKFHLNTNAFIQPPAKSVRRLKISLDSCDPLYWDHLVGRSGAFATVYNNIKKASEQTITTITYTLTKENYKDAPKFAKFAENHFPSLYAIFFSIYKGCNPKYQISVEDSEIFFNKVLQKLEHVLNKESLSLLHETIDEKRRLIAGCRFPEQNQSSICYLSMSERVISPLGEKFTCSHLYRDGVHMQTPNKHEKCFYGCNRRLVQFNEYVFNEINKKNEI